MRKMRNASIAEMLERETAIVKGRITRELQGKAITPYSPPYAYAEKRGFPLP